MKCHAFLIYGVICTLIQTCIFSLHPLYAADSGHHEIREMSSKKSDQLFNEIAVKLFNGKSHLVSLDNMVEVLKNYRIVEFHTDGIQPAKEIILKEVAFRMLKQHYLPRVGDKIRVYKLQRNFLQETGIRSAVPDGLESNIRLPLETATIKDQEQLKAIYWANLVTQISTAIEKLWLKRIGFPQITANSRSDKEIFLQAAVFLRRKFIPDELSSIDYSHDRSPASSIVNAIEKKIEFWLNEGIILKKDIPVLIEILIQYLILSNSREATLITDEINGFRDINGLGEALQHRIKSVTETIQNHDPTDYGAFAMLQGLLNEVNLYFSVSPNNATEYPTKADFYESRHSA